MIPIITVLLGIFLFLFSGITSAKSSYGSMLCANDNHFYCYTVKNGDTWNTLFEDPQKRDLAMRINRINIRLQRGMTIAIPAYDGVDPLDYAPFHRQISAPGEKVIFVSLKELAFGAYDSGGNLEYWGPVSGGRGYCPDVGRGCHTPRGVFTIYQKGSSGCVSSKFPIGRGGAPMPYCMFFHGGMALHGSPEVPGYNASHGCVRLFVNDARWLNQNFTYNERVRVIVN